MCAEDNVIQILLKNPLFHEFSVSELSGVLGQLAPEQMWFAPGDVLLRAGEFTGRVGLVVLGNLSIYRSGKLGCSHELSQRTANELFGLTALFCSSGRSPVTITAATAAQVLFFDLRPLLDDPRYAQRIKDAALRTMSQRTVGDIIKIDLLLASSVRERILIYLSSLRELSTDDVLQVHISQTELARYLGVNRSVLSRELHRMERDGILEILPNRRYRMCRWNLEGTAPEQPGQERTEKRLIREGKLR